MNPTDKHPELRGARDLSQAPLPEHPYWAEPVLLKGGSLLLGGPTKIGKSLMLMDAAASLASGGCLWGAYPIPSPARVLYLERELGLYGVQKRLHVRAAAGAPEPSENWFVVSRSPKYNPATFQGLQELKALVGDIGAEVLILDPAGRFTLNDVYGPDVAQFFDHLDQLQADFPDLSYILGHHTAQQPKNTEGREGWDPLSVENFRGTTRWAGSVDTALMLARRPASGDPTAKWFLDGRWVLRHAEDIEDTRFAVGHDFSVQVRGRAPQSGGGGYSRPRPSRATSAGSALPPDLLSRLKRGSS